MGRPEPSQYSHENVYGKRFVRTNKSGAHLVVVSQHLTDAAAQLLCVGNVQKLVGTFNKTAKTLLTEWSFYRVYALESEQFNHGRST